MNENWQEFEKKRDLLHKKYKKLKRKPKLIWLVYNIIIEVCLFAFIGEGNYPYAILISLLSFTLSSVYMIKAINNLSKVEAEQDLLLMNDAPVGKLKI